MIHNLFKNSHLDLGFSIAAFFYYYSAGNQLLFQDIWFVFHPSSGTGRVSQPHFPGCHWVLLKKKIQHYKVIVSSPSGVFCNFTYYLVDRVWWGSVFHKCPFIFSMNLLCHLQQAILSCLLPFQCISRSWKRGQILAKHCSIPGSLLSASYTECTLHPTSSATTAKWWEAEMLHVSSF